VIDRSLLQLHPVGEHYPFNGHAFETHTDLRHPDATPHAPPVISFVDASSRRRVQPLASLSAVACGGATSSGAAWVDANSGGAAHAARSLVRFVFNARSRSDRTTALVFISVPNSLLIRRRSRSSALRSLIGNRTSTFVSMKAECSRTDDV
jgi:hypothetical protein